MAEMRAVESGVAAWNESDEAAFAEFDPFAAAAAALAKTL